MIDELFWARVETLENGCKVWTGCLTEDGYGRVRRRKRSWLTHRWSWFLRYGAVPPELDHKCRNRACVNTDHLRSTTHADNVPFKIQPRCGHIYDKITDYEGRRCSLCRSKQLKQACIKYRRKLRDQKLQQQNPIGLVTVT